MHDRLWPKKNANAHNARSIDRACRGPSLLPLSCADTLALFSIFFFACCHHAKRSRLSKLATRIWYTKHQLEENTSDPRSMQVIKSYVNNVPVAIHGRWTCFISMSGGIDWQSKYEATIALQQTRTCTTGMSRSLFEESLLTRCVASIFLFSVSVFVSFFLTRWCMMLMTSWLCVDWKTRPVSLLWKTFKSCGKTRLLLWTDLKSRARWTRDLDEPIYFA